MWFVDTRKRDIGRPGGPTWVGLVGGRRYPMAWKVAVDGLPEARSAFPHSPKATVHLCPPGLPTDAHADSVAASVGDRS